MAKSVRDKDSFTYMKERDDFLKELKQFHINRGTPYMCVPKIGGKEVDLSLLFRKVQELGGFTKVTEEFSWDEVQAALKIPVACGNASQGLKNLYLRLSEHSDLDAEAELNCVSSTSLAVSMRSSATHYPTKRYSSSPAPPNFSGITTSLSTSPIYVTSSESSPEAKYSPRPHLASPVAGPSWRVSPIPNSTWPPPNASWASNSQSTSPIQVTSSESSPEAKYSQRQHLASPVNEPSWKASPPQNTNFPCTSPIQVTSSESKPNNMKKLLIRGPVRKPPCDGYLDVYQKVLSGQDPDQRNRDEYDDMSSASKRTKSSVSQVPMVYRHHLHNIPDMLRLNAGLSRNLVERHGQQKLERALLSGFPNEVDFAINVATLLSNEGKHKLQLGHCQRIVDLFLAHVGIFREGASLFEVYHDCWKPLTGRNFFRFWLDTVSEKEIRALLLPECLSAERADVKSSDVCKEKTDSDNICMEELFNLGSDLGVHCVEGQRALQIATILRNLSFENENKEILANDKLVLRFLLLCTYCNYSTLKQLALDTLGNLSCQLALEPIELHASQLIMKTIAKCIGSQDRFEIVRGLEIISRLCLVTSNQDFISLNLVDKVYEDVTNYLTVHDIQLIVFTLEAMYQLSKLGEVTATNFATCKSVIDILVSLITVEAQSYGPNSLQGIKVVEHVPAGSLSTQPATASSTPVLNRMAPPPVPSTTPRPTQPQHLQPQRPVMVISSPVIKQPPPQTTIPTPALPAASYPELDAEVTARSWLTSHLEAGTGDIGKNELYSDYVNACGRHHLRCVQTAMFPKCIRFAFPKVESYSVEKNGSTELFYRGICKRKQTLPFPPLQGGVGLPQVPSSARIVIPPAVSLSSESSPTSNGGVLQTQLGSPTHSRQAQVSPTSPTQTQHPILQQALSGAHAESQPTDTQKIKSLIAKKLAMNNRLAVASHAPSQPGSNTNPVLPMQAHGHSGPSSAAKTEVCSTTLSSQPSASVIASQLGQPGKPLVGQPAVAGMGGHSAVMERLANKISGNTTAEKPNSGPSKDSTAESQALPQQSNVGDSKEPKEQLFVDASKSLSCQQTPSSNLSNIQPSSDHPVSSSSSVSVTSSFVSSSVKPSINGPMDSDKSAVAENGAKWTLCKRGNNALTEKQNIPEKGSFVKLEECGSQSDTKSSHAKDLQHVNGNTNQSDSCSPVEFKRKEMLSPEEIQHKKTIINHWLETKTAKDNAPILNGVAKHIGNGDSHAKLNDLIRSQEHLQDDLTKSNKVSVDARSTNTQNDMKNVVENGFASPYDSEEKMEVDQSDASKSVSSGGCPIESQSLETPCQSSVIAAEQQVSDSVGSGPPTSQSSGAVTPDKVAKGGDTAQQQSMPALPLPLQSEALPSVAYVPPPAPASKGLGHMSVADLLKKKATQNWQQQLSTPSNGPTSTADSSSEGQSPSIPTADQLQASLRAAQSQPPPTTKSVIMSQLQARLHSPIRLPSPQQTTVVTAAPSISQNPIMVAALKGPLLQMSNAADGTVVVSSTTNSSTPEAGGQSPEKPVNNTELSLNQTTPITKQPLTTVSSMVMRQKRPLTARAQEHLAAKRKRSSSTDSSASSASQSSELMCEWSGCCRCFESAKAVAGHVIQEHITTVTGEGLCKWQGCDSLLRKKYSLITHIQDRHMTESSLRAAAQKRQQSGGAPKTPSSTAAPASAPVPVYPDHAAYQAISRFAIRPPYPELLEMKEGPVTKHIRLTSALILRNLAKYSAIARSSIRRHERHIAYVALSAVESSTALSECLWELNRKH